MRYLQTLIAHVPVALISVEENGRVQLLNMAARRLFETSLDAQFTASHAMASPLRWDLECAASRDAAPS